MTVMNELNGLSAVVTGAASGLGEATARALAARGAKVAIFDMNEERAALVAGETGGIYAKVNVAEEGDVRAGLAQAEAAHGPVRIAINCAGIAASEKTVSKGVAHDLERFANVLKVNLIGTFNVLRLAALGMTNLEPLPSGDRGVIVNTASIAAFDGQIGQAAYAASKGGIAGMTLPIARDLARDRIRVVAIAPGLFRTPLLAGLPEKTVSALEASIPNPPRLGDPDEYAALAVHICENTYLNGEVIRLDGALRMAPK